MDSGLASGWCVDQEVARELFFVLNGVGRGLSRKGDNHDTGRRSSKGLFGPWQALFECIISGIRSWTGGA